MRNRKKQKIDDKKGAKGVWCVVIGLAILAGGIWTIALATTSGGDAGFRQETNVFMNSEEQSTNLPEGFELTYELLEGETNITTHTWYSWTLKYKIIAYEEIFKIELHEVYHAWSYIEFTNASIGSINISDSGKGQMSSKHLYWLLSELNTGEEAELTVVLALGVNPGGNQELTSPGYYTLSDGPTVTAETSDGMTAEESAEPPEIYAGDEDKEEDDNGIDDEVTDDCNGDDMGDVYDGQEFEKAFVYHPHEWLKDYPDEPPEDLVHYTEYSVHWKNGSIYAEYYFDSGTEVVSEPFTVVSIGTKGIRASFTTEDAEDLRDNFRYWEITFTVNEEMLGTLSWDSGTDTLVSYTSFIIPGADEDRTIVVATHKFRTHLNADVTAHVSITERFDPENPSKNYHSEYQNQENVEYDYLKIHEGTVLPSQIDSYRNCSASAILKRVHEDSNEEVSYGNITLRTNTTSLNRVDSVNFFWMPGLDEPISVEFTLLSMETTRCYFENYVIHFKWDGGSEEWNVVTDGEITSEISVSINYTGVLHVTVEYETFTDYLSGGNFEVVIGETIIY